jgi:L-amino acid N-acyltransferase YncA
VIAEPLKVRVALKSDAAGMVATYTPIVGETAISFVTTPPGVEEMAARVRSTLLTHSFLVCE